MSKLQILALAAKVLVLAPAESQLLTISQYLSNLARYDLDYDIRDRSRFLHGLLRGVRVDKQDDRTHNEDEGADLGGVILRREQVRLVLLGKREAMSDTLVLGGEVKLYCLVRTDRAHQDRGLRWAHCQESHISDWPVIILFPTGLKIQRMPLSGIQR